MDGELQDLSAARDLNKVFRNVTGNMTCKLRCPQITCKIYQIGVLFFIPVMRWVRVSAKVQPLNVSIVHHPDRRNTENPSFSSSSRIKSG